MELEHVGLPVASKILESDYFRLFLGLLQKTLKSIRLVGVFRSQKRDSSGQNVVEPFRNGEVLSNIGKIENIQKIELIEIPSLNQSFIKDFVNCKKLKCLSLSWERVLKWLKSTYYII